MGDMRHIQGRMGRLAGCSGSWLFSAGAMPWIEADQDIDSQSQILQQGRSMPWTN